MKEADSNYGHRTLLTFNRFVPVFTIYIPRPVISTKHLAEAKLIMLSVFRGYCCRHACRVIQFILLSARQWHPLNVNNRGITAE